MSCGDGYEESSMSVSYGAGLDDEVEHTVQLDPESGSLENHLHAEGPVTYSVSSSAGSATARSAFKVTGSNADTYYETAAGGGQTQMWLTSRYADSIQTKNTASSSTGTSTSAAQVSGTRNANLDYYGFADANALHTEQRAAAGAGRGDDGPISNAEGALGSRILFNEQSQNAQGDYAYTELYGLNAHVPFYEGRADTSATGAYVTAYPNGMPGIEHADKISIWQYTRNGNSYALNQAYAEGLTGTGFSLTAPVIALSGNSYQPTARINGISANGNLVRATGEQYNGVDKYAVKAEGLGSASLSGSIGSTGGSAATLSSLSLTGTTSAKLEDWRKIGGAVQDVVLTRPGSSFSGVTATSSSAKGPIQNCVDLAAGSGDTLTVAAGTYRENVAISKSLTINGAGSANTIVNGDRDGDGVGDGSVFTINNDAADVNVVLAGLKITNGGAGNGGGIRNRETLTLANSEVSGNTANQYGGGIFNDYGTVTVTGATISGNTANYGGGIRNMFGTATVNGGTIRGNTAYYQAGGIFNDGTLVLNQYGGSKIEIYDNRAIKGGGIFINSGAPPNYDNCEFGMFPDANTPDDHYP